MSENDNKDFEFIKEHVIEKKRKKLRKKLMPILMTICLAIIFGLVAAITFALSEPRLLDLLHKEEETKKPANFPTGGPVENDVTGIPTASGGSNGVGQQPNNNTADPADVEDLEDDETDTKPESVIVEQYIEADLEDYTKMYGDIRKLSLKVDQSLITVEKVTEKVDVVFGTPVEMAEETTGLVIHNNDVEFIILVSYDRVKDADSIKVKFSDTAKVNAILQDYDSELNLAVIAVKLADIPSTYLNGIQPAILGASYTLAVGTPVIALGSPNGHVGSMDIGIVTSRNSSIYVTDNKLDLFNTDITENENSDGIIVNMKGEVIGLITRTLKDDRSKGLSTAIGISKLTGILSDMVDLEPHIYFGVMTEDMTDQAKLEHEITNGIFVNEVLEDSPAFEAGLQAGDIILQVNDQTIINTNNFYNAIAAYAPQQEVTVKLKRTTGKTEKEIELTVTLIEKEK